MINDFNVSQRLAETRGTCRPAFTESCCRYTFSPQRPKRASGASPRRLVTTTLSSPALMAFELKERSERVELVSLYENAFAAAAKSLRHELFNTLWRKAQSSRTDATTTRVLPEASQARQLFDAGSMTYTPPLDRSESLRNAYVVGLNPDQLNEVEQPGSNVASGTFLSPHGPSPRTLRGLWKRESKARLALEQEERAYLETLLASIEEAKVSSPMSRFNWTSEGQDVDTEVLESAWDAVFERMHSRLRSDFCNIFPQGLSGVQVNDVGRTIFALLLIDMAIADSDLHSFGFTFIPGEKMSIETCSGAMLPVYFAFMAFKTSLRLLPLGNSALVAFRVAVCQYFKDPRSATPTVFRQPLLSLINALRPMVTSVMFNRRTLAFFRLAEELAAEHAVRTMRMKRRGVDQDAMLVFDDDELDQIFNEDGTMRSGSFDMDNPSHHLNATQRPSSTMALPENAVDFGGIIALKGSEIGRGAFGVVFRADRFEHHQVMAIKEVNVRHRSIVSDAEGIEQVVSAYGSLASNVSHKVHSFSTGASEEQLAAEINMLRRLHHPNLITYYGSRFDAVRGVVSILMECADTTVRNVVARFGHLSEDAIAHYALQVLNGLAYLHDQHIIHRDIKAENVLVTSGGEAKLSDFGLSKLTAVELEGESPSMKKMGDVRLEGTPLFMAPEIVRGGIHSEKSDVWAFGCFLIELASGRTPWSEKQFAGPEAVVWHLGMTTTGPPLPDTDVNGTPLHYSSDFRDFFQQCVEADSCLRPSALHLLRHSFLVRKFSASCRAADSVNDLLAPV